MTIHKLCHIHIYIYFLFISLIKIQTDETREVCHMLYTAWPDYGVPQSARALLQFLSLVRQQQNKLLTSRGDTWAGHPRGPPIVVHCSAGIGRTGIKHLLRFPSISFIIIHCSKKKEISIKFVYFQEHFAPWISAYLD